MQKQGEPHPYLLDFIASCTGSSESSCMFMLDSLDYELLDNAHGNTATNLNYEEGSARSFHPERHMVTQCLVLTRHINEGHEEP